MKITYATIAPLLTALQAGKIKHRVVGSLAKKGWSDHDADILIYFKAKGYVSDPEEWPAYLKYTKLMQKLGYKRMHTSYDYEEWHKGEIIVDIIPIAEGD